MSDRLLTEEEIKAACQTYGISLSLFPLILLKIQHVKTLRTVAEWLTASHGWKREERAIRALMHGEIPEEKESVRE